MPRFVVPILLPGGGRAGQHACVFDSTWQAATQAWCCSQAHAAAAYKQCMQPASCVELGSPLSSASRMPSTSLCRSNSRCARSDTSSRPSTCVCTAGAAAAKGAVARCRREPHAKQGAAARGAAVPTAGSDSAFRQPCRRSRPAAVRVPAHLHPLGFQLLNLLKQAGQVDHDAVANHIHRSPARMHAHERRRRNVAPQAAAADAATATRSAAAGHAGCTPPSALAAARRVRVAAAMGPAWPRQQPPLTC